ncbi:hypothetical protein [Acidithrix ferrooxidans]|uniref:Uncharacterized protein n=1 Tax=Acidithrix ferrooxidans TaxID=1280514 RepID=A0A0D8HKF8_9ACTN|nr:hypothetical protein [Acidithrix ferrooxidans]KJF17591.1 hypothetical protein AXFE_14910 [Acidithrix ferrooxidans]
MQYYTNAYTVSFLALIEGKLGEPLKADKSTFFGPNETLINLQDREPLAISSYEDDEIKQRYRKLPSIYVASKRRRITAPFIPTTFRIETEPFISFSDEGYMPTIVVTLPNNEICEIAIASSLASDLEVIRKNHGAIRNAVVKVDQVPNHEGSRSKIKFMEYNYD